MQARTWDEEVPDVEELEVGAVDALGHVQPGDDAWCVDLSADRVEWGRGGCWKGIAALYADGAVVVAVVVVCSEL